MKLSKITAFLVFSAGFSAFAGGDRDLEQVAMGAMGTGIGAAGWYSEYRRDKKDYKLFGLKYKPFNWRAPFRSKLSRQRLLVRSPWVGLTAMGSFLLADHYTSNLRATLKDYYLRAKR
jgi:hypothetical protein